MAAMRICVKTPLKILFDGTSGRFPQNLVCISWASGLSHICIYMVKHLKILSADLDETWYERIGDSSVLYFVQMIALVDLDLDLPILRRGQILQLWTNMGKFDNDGFF